MFMLALIHTALAERTDTVSSPSASLAMNDQWAAQFYTATQDATLTRVAVSGYESMAGAATVDVYLWTRVAAGGYTATSLGTLSFVGASWSAYTLDLATPRGLVAGQIYGIGFVSNDVAWIPWSTSSRDPVIDTVWGTGLGFNYGAAATSGSRDLPSSTRFYAYGGPSFSMTVALADLDADGFDVLDDCDDRDATVYPAAPEVWYDGIDQGCDGRVDDDDADGDGYDADFAGGDDCDDTSRAIHPRARRDGYRCRQWGHRRYGDSGHGYRGHRRDRHRCRGRHRRARWPQPDALEGRRYQRLRHVARARIGHPRADERSVGRTPRPATPGRSLTVG